MITEVVSDVSKNDKSTSIDDSSKENILMGRQMKMLFKPRALLKETTNVNVDRSREAAVTTPKKERLPFDAVSPTANLKLLTDMASLKTNYEEGEFSDGVPSAPKTVPGSRKDKSLSLLCKKFLDKYPEYPPNGTEMELSVDEASKELHVERRRIYDIVNVLESIEMMQRAAKNCYKWYGKMNLTATLARLKTLGHLEKLDEQFVTMQTAESKVRIVEIDSSDNSRDDGSTSSLLLVGEEVLYSRKEKSLGAMSKKFVMLFLVVKPKIISLEAAANVLIRESNVDSKSTAYKTKIRRLYDIANILSSLDLIRKVHVSELYGRKPAFEYIGPEVDDVILDPSSITTTTPSFILPQNNRRIVGSGLKRILSDSMAKESPAKFQRTKSETCLQSIRRHPKPHGNSLLVRHTSLQDVCAVAERERSKINAQCGPINAITTNPGSFTTLKMTSSNGKPFQFITFASSSSSPVRVLKLPILLRVEKAPNGNRVVEQRSLLVNVGNKPINGNSVELESLAQPENGSELDSKYPRATDASECSSDPSLLTKANGDKPISLISKNIRMTR